MLKYASKEGVKAYVQGNGLTVQSVMITAKLKDATAQKRQMSEQEQGNVTFRKTLEKACERQTQGSKKPQNIICYTSGYTKNAQAFIYQVERKEYC